ncbi:DNA translocase FtsK [Rhizobium deserti]|uniref:DNA translocase FtsK n=1 Tax=Rhizobium deserti TaxID=2547961 RepID=UPI003CCAF982
MGAQGDELPIWQTAFALKPNVRFTRTPEKAISKRPPGETLSVQTAIAPARPSRPSPEMPQMPKTSFEQRSVERGLVTRGLPVEAAPGARALVDELHREFVAPARTEQKAKPSVAAIPRHAAFRSAVHAPVSSPMASAAPTKNHAQLTAPAAHPLAHLASHLPDHLFWEAMSLGTANESTVSQTALTPKVNAPRPHSPTRANMAAIDLQPISPPLDVDGQSPVLHYRAFTLRSASTATEPPAFKEAPQPQESFVGAPVVTERVTAPDRPAANSFRSRRPSALQTNTHLHGGEDYELPSSELLQEPQTRQATTMSQDALEQSAGLLESVLEDFGVKGEIVDVRPGPVVTLYEFEPAPGVKSSRVIGLSDDIARSMSALSARVAVVPGRNVIGIELPNPIRETVYFRELIESDSYQRTNFSLPLCLGKTIGGEPVIADLAKMPHLLVAGTTGSGKSVSVNTMILSLLFQLRPEECRLIMVDPKMLELSIYDGIPHLLTPVVTDPKKAVLALKWAVREMEDRYRKMSRLGVRNIDGYNARVAGAREAGETIMISVQIGFDRSTGEPIHEDQEMDLSPLPYIVVIVDEMADLMMVAGKDIEGAIQRLAQMARAAGIHLIMATQRPSVDVITGTIKANFPTRISFQVTSKIDSRTILGEQGAEHLLGQGDMLHMVGGGRIARVHGPFVSDHEVEAIVAHLKNQGRPQYLGTVTEDADEGEAEEEDTAVFDKSATGEEDGNDLYDRAVKIVLRDKKCSTSYIQRRLSIGYNRAASLVERMEKEGLVGPANHVGKRAIIAGEAEAATSDGLAS